jgi:pre-mRNA-processing factor 40
MLFAVHMATDMAFSVLLHLSLGRNTLRRGVESIGTIPRQNKARGKCLMSTRRLYLRKHLLRRRSHRMQIPDSTSVVRFILIVHRAPTFVAGGGFSASQFDQPREREPLGEARQIAYGNDVNGSRAQVFVPANTDPDYATFEEAEAAFLKLLRRNNIDPNWTWEQTMRSIIKDPQYRALKDPKDRKAAFEKYAVEVRLQEKDRAKERIEKLRKDFATMLSSHPEIKHYTRWKTARPIIEGETIFRSAKDDDERRQLFEDYIIELKKASVEREVTTRKAAMDELIEILRGLDLEPYTRWSEAQGIIQSNQRFQGDEKFKSLSKSDMLTAFENHIKTLEKTFNDARQQQKNQKSRRERQNRDRFLSLLHELKASNKIKAGSKWSKIHPLIVTDERYQAMLGQPGSTPLDLFLDMVEEEERALRSTRNDVLDVLDVSISFIVRNHLLIFSSLRTNGLKYSRRQLLRSSLR